MYVKPKLERFGTFRELTQSGPFQDTDSSTLSNNGCQFKSAADCDEIRS